MASQVTMKDVRLIFRNFEGRPDKFNKEGKRTFGVILPDPSVAEAMIDDDWNIKWLKPREEDEAEGEEPVPWLPVEAAYDKGRPPRVVMITSRGPTPLNEHTIETLDSVNMLKVDLIVNPYTWEVNGRGGVKGYLQTMYVTIEEDELEREYAELYPQ